MNNNGIREYCTLNHGFANSQRETDTNMNAAVAAQVVNLEKRKTFLMLMENFKIAQIAIKQSLSLVLEIFAIDTFFSENINKPYT